MPSQIIRELRVRAICVPMRHPHNTASGVVSESPLVLTDLVTDEGIVGHSITFTYTKAALQPTALLIKGLEPLIQGRPLQPRELELQLARKFRLLGPQGLVGMALAAIDMAAWDALARSHSVALVELLGGTHKPIRAYGAVGFDGVEGSARAARAWAERGFGGVKAKIGYPTVEDDLAVIRAIRKEVGDRFAIMVDYNQCLAPAEAIGRMRRLEGEGLEWVEEPTLAHDYVGHARVAAEIRTPVQCGENWWGTLDMQHAMDAGASDYIMLDVMKIGGVSGWLRAAAMAEPRGIRISSHLWSEISAQLLCLTPTAHWLEYSDWWNEILGQPLEIDQGWASTAGALGTGVCWNEQAIAKYSD